MISPPMGERDGSFAANLDALARAPDGRQALAILRRAAGARTVRFEALRVLDRVIPRGATERDLAAYELVAGLYGVYHQGRTNAGSMDGDLGESFARLGSSPGWTAERAARQLARILAADAATLPERLRRALTLLRSADVPIAWGRLARDVRDWDRDDQRVQRRWARSFVAGGRSETTDATGHPITPEGET